MKQTLSIQAAMELPEMRACASELRLAEIDPSRRPTAHEVSLKLEAAGIKSARRIAIKAAMAHAGLLAE